MESPAFFFTFFLWFLLLSATGYSVYISFGPPSKKLRDPFEEHEDKSENLWFSEFPKKIENFP